VNNFANAGPANGLYSKCRSNVRITPDYTNADPRTGILTQLYEYFDSTYLNADPPGHFAGH
jgi:hypothetical protein